MAEAVYVLCALSSAVCAVLLFRQYRAIPSELLLWSGLCFWGLALNNLLLVADRIVFPMIDFSLWRSLSALLAMLVLIFGFIWELR
jgi:hypothetical protein